jgi:hypothetical protein
MADEKKDESREEMEKRHADERKKMDEKEPKKK